MLDMEAFNDISTDNDSTLCGQLWGCYKHLRYLTGNDVNLPRGVKKFIPSAEFKRRFRATLSNDITNNMSAAESFL